MPLTKPSGRRSRRSCSIHDVAGEGQGRDAGAEVGKLKVCDVALRGRNVAMAEQLCDRDDVAATGRRGVAPASPATSGAFPWQRLDGAKWKAVPKAAVEHPRKRPEGGIDVSLDDGVGRSD